MVKDLKALRISLASPQQILAWSYGEVKKPETINYRTHRAEVDGLMDESIFGPSKNHECYCGKYKKVRYKGIVCDQCGVEVTNKRVRRERMGHIKLASPVTHVWFAYGIPNKLSLMLNIPQKKLETVIYYARYIVTDFSESGKEKAIEALDDKYQKALDDLKAELDEVLAKDDEDFKAEVAKLKKGKESKDKIALTIQNLESKNKKSHAKLKSVYKQKEENLKQKFEKIKQTVQTLQAGTTLSEEEYSQLVEYDIDFFDLGMGAEAVRKLLSKINLEEEIINLEEEVKKSRSEIKRRKLTQRLRIIKGMKLANIDPSWVVMDVVPVLPPDLRPIIQLPGGRFATSDLNDLYRRVINRNNRLLRLIKLGAPEIILRNEKRMLQEAVDALIDNSHRPGTTVLNSRDQAYKSLSDMLRGKQGRFRQNLLGKRVDYSARSVIVAGPEMSIYNCGLPKAMALELFKPFVLSEILVQGLAPNIKSAKLFYDSQSPEVWDILEKVTKNHPVLLNRAPTLHKQGIQAFFPVLVEGNAIRLHPMVCGGFNADFDGDQMAVHVPLTRKAIDEVVTNMFAKSNLLLMADGSPVVNAAKDMALGIYYLTGVNENSKIRYFGGVTEVLGAYELQQIGINDKVKIIYKGKLIESTPGKLMFNEILPEDFRYIDEQLDKKKIGKLSAEILDEYGNERVVEYLDNVKRLGFKFATRSGISVSFEDFVVSEEKDEILQEVINKESQFTSDYYMGLVTLEERKRLVEESWIKAIDQIADVTIKKYRQEKTNVITLNDSGALPVENPLRQISGVKGLILDPQGRIVELPIRSSYKDGLSSLEYFVAARGTRKGLADTALKTAESGYLTRRLVDIAQDVIVRSEDCGTDEGVWITREASRRLSFGERLKGRYVLEDVINPKTKEVVVANGEIIDKKTAALIEETDGITNIHARSPMTCKTLRGVCQKCYGYSLGTGKLVEMGIAVGIIAAQAMGEAATQLTLNTKHLAGRAGTDITQGLPRVEELFEARTPKLKAVLAEIDGKIKIETDEVLNVRTISIANSDQVVKTYEVNEGDKVEFKKSKKVKEGATLIIRKDGTEVASPANGNAELEDGKVKLTIVKDSEKEYQIPMDMALLVENGQEVTKGTVLTEGSVDPKELLVVSGLLPAQECIIDGIQETYGIQGIALDDRHVEIIVRQMSRFGRVIDAGDSDLLPGSYVDTLHIHETNRKLAKEGKAQVKYKPLLLGLTTASVKTESFLSAASFQEQVRVLTDAALIGEMDYLRGLKENVIIGRPVPLGKELK